MSNSQTPAGGPDTPMALFHSSPTPAVTLSGPPFRPSVPPDLVVCRNFNDLEGNMMASRGGAPGQALDPIPIAFLKRSIDDWIREEACTRHQRPARNRLRPRLQASGRA